MMSSERLLVVLAGPNGSGKSTFFEHYLAPLGLRFVNADLIAKNLASQAPEAIAYEAAQIADAERRLLLTEGQSFCMETVFSDPNREKLNFLREAKAQGYTIFLVFICLEFSDLNIARVIQRVSDGGHDVPDDKSSAVIRAASIICDWHCLLWISPCCSTTVPCLNRIGSSLCCKTTRSSR